MIHDQPTEEHYEEFIDPDTEMDVLNKSIEITGESPIKKQRLKSSADTFSKKSKIQETVSLTLFKPGFFWLSMTGGWIPPPPPSENNVTVELGQ